ncbi:hypothetical protein VPH35_020873 [Triticum aestivum]
MPPPSPTSTGCHLRLLLPPPHLPPSHAAASLPRSPLICRQRRRLPCPRSSSHGPTNHQLLPIAMDELELQVLLLYLEAQGCSRRQGDQPQPANPSCPHATAGSFSRPAGSRRPHPRRCRRSRHPRVHSTGEVRLSS